MRVLLLIATLGLASPSFANPIDALGLGPRAQGLAGAFTALADDFSGNYYNPAGLASRSGLSLSLGYAYAKPWLKVGDADLEVDSSRGFEGGVVMGGRVLGRRVAASFGLFLPDGVVSRIRALPQAQPRFVVYDNRPQRLWLATSLSIEVLPNFFVGAGVTFLANTTGTLSVSGDVAFFDETQTELYSGVDVDLTAIRYPTFGLQYHLGKHWRFGFSWREAFTLKLDLTVQVGGDIVDDSTDDKDPVVEDASFVLRAQNRNFFSPRQLTWGIAYLLPRTTLSLDVAWVQWSQFPAPAAELDMALSLGPLPYSLPPLEQPVEPAFEDIVVVRVGAETRLADGRLAALLLRGGYAYEPSPVPEQKDLTNYVDSDKHLFSIGVTLELKRLKPLLPQPLQFQFAAQLIWLPETRIHKTNPADPVGSYRARGLIAGGSFLTRMTF